MANPQHSTADRYRRFAIQEARGNSSCYEQWSMGIADDERLIKLIDQLPVPKRQPNLVLGAARFVGAEAGPFEAFQSWLSQNWAAVRQVATTRSTQTNEVGRCAILLPALAGLAGPLALIEVGASAGLCLYPDRFSYEYKSTTASTLVRGESAVVLSCEASGPVPVPAHVPKIVWRAGIDLNPVAVESDDDIRWLRTLIWPEHDHRRERFDAAVEIARIEPPYLVRGDLNEEIGSLVAQAPAGATVVVFHSAVLAYVAREDRVRFAETMKVLPVHWISNESLGASPDFETQLPRPIWNGAQTVLTLDRVPIAFAAPHGQSLQWFS